MLGVVEALNRNIRVATTLLRQAITSMGKFDRAEGAHVQPATSVDAQVFEDFWLATDDLWRALDSSGLAAGRYGHANGESADQELSAGREGGEAAEAFTAWLDDRRRSARAGGALQVRWNGLPEDEEASTSDISEGGCFIEWPASPAVGERLLLELKVPTGRWVGLSGEVKYHKSDAGFGVQFIGIGELEQVILGLLIGYSGG